MRIIAALLVIFCLSWPGFAVQPKKRPSSHAAHTAQKKKGRRRASTRKNLAQMAPTPERYQEIQQALVAKGYGPQAPNGVWGPEWASALKRYQQDQKLEPTGKLNSLSLITLGLGPKREQPAGVTAPPVPQPAGTTAPPVPQPTGTTAPPVPQPAGTTAPPAPQPAGTTAPPAPPADQPSSSSSTVREPK